MSTLPTPPLLPKKLTAIEAIGPAYENAKRIMLKPFRWARWWRMGLIAMASAEMAQSYSCGGPSFNMPTNFPKPNTPSHGVFGQGLAFQDLPSSDHGWMDVIRNIPPEKIAMFVTVLILCGIILALVHLYVNSVSRFMLFDAVVAERFKLLAGWNLWERHGRSYFFFQLVLIVLEILFFGGLLAAAIAIAGGSGLLSALGGKSGPAVATFLITIACYILLIFVLSIPLILFRLMAKDVAIPIMAVEGIRVREALGRAWRMVKAEGGAFTLYVVAKIILAIALGIVLGIIQTILMFIMILPIGAGAIVTAVNRPDFFSDPMVIAGLVTSVIVFILFMMTLMAILGSPVTVFFQSYTLFFLSGRYQRLYEVLYPAAPEQPAPPVADMPLGMTPGDTPAM